MSLAVALCRVIVIGIGLLHGLVGAAGLLNVIVLGWYGIDDTYPAFVHLVTRAYGSSVPGVLLLLGFFVALALPFVNLIGGFLGMWWLIRFKERGRRIALVMCWIYLAALLPIAWLLWWGWADGTPAGARYQVPLGYGFIVAMMLFLLQKRVKGVFSEQASR